MPYEYCSAKLFPQDSKYNLCNFSFFQCVIKVVIILLKP